MELLPKVFFVSVLFSASAAFSQAGPVASPASSSMMPGPCRAWLFPCGRGTWVCTTEAAYWGFIYGPQPECPAVYPQTTAPPPGECRLVNGACKFTDTELSCKAFVEQFRGNKCGNVSEYTAFIKSTKSLAPEGFGQYPPPNELCLPINETCQWYDPCLYWRDEFCAGDFTCGSADEYYAFLYGPHDRPSCTSPSAGQIPPVSPPGQCAIKKDKCDWYECTSWLDWCGGYWLCGTEYDKETYKASPPPPCPAPLHPPVKPGTCRFNTSAGKCDFFPNNTAECVSWIDKCGSSWLCGTMLQREIYANLPPLPCPLPPRPPVKPGTCRLNVSDGQCNFFPNKSQDTTPCNQPIYPPGYKPTCAMLEQQWTFNSTSKQCMAFAYSPCGEEREGYDVFATEEECVKTCIHRDPCQQPIYPPGFSPARCNALIKQWTYNSTIGQCVEFYYYPCAKDRDGYDVFTSYEECTSTCTHQDPCQQPIYPPGFIPRCDVLIKQWTYNSTTGQCVEFYYHPCGEDRDGYDVFTSYEECTRTCTHQDPCQQPIYPPGFIPNCDVLIKQWTYNSTTGQCIEFYYHPCGEDRDGYDVFTSYGECAMTCLHRDPCRESIYPPGYVPHCMVVQKQWTYNQTNQQCVEFNYHPCGEDRNGYNVFVTEEECTKSCVHHLDPCHQPIYPPGFEPSCRVLIKQWTYDPKTKRCVEFEYYPCGEDRDGYDVFANEVECINACMH